MLPSVRSEVGDLPPVTTSTFTSSCSFFIIWNSNFSELGPEQVRNMSASEVVSTSLLFVFTGRCWRLHSPLYVSYLSDRCATSRWKILNILWSASGPVWAQRPSACTPDGTRILVTRQRFKLYIWPSQDVNSIKMSKPASDFGLNFNNVQILQRFQHKVGYVFIAG